MMRSIPFIPILFFGTGLFAQTLTATTSVPGPGHVENRARYVLVGVNDFATSGTGNVWDASGAVADGSLSATLYYAPDASPFAGQYPAATLCAQRLPSYFWFHYSITPIKAEILGVDEDEWMWSSTLCSFPLELGDSFTDSYEVSGTTYFDTITYVASGVILAPWGTIQNVVMTWNGNMYEFYSADNVLERIGHYNPGGVALWKVDVVTGMNEIAQGHVGLWPNPAASSVELSLPFPSTWELNVLDVRGQLVRTARANGETHRLALADLIPSLYMVVAVSSNGYRAANRFVVE